MAPAEYVASPWSFVADQVALYESTNGAEGNLMQGLPCVIVTSVGARSGAVRKTPLMRVEHGGDYLVVASQGGAPKNPNWYFNLVAHPECELRDLNEVTSRRARELVGEERELWWARAVAAFAPYAEYQTKTERVIPILLLEP
jgi:deazaflavin-dependent oxidoreductase (nitroreductase family)